MNYKLIAMDFDGTLLTNEKSITPKTKKILQNLKEKGYLIVGVTARILRSAEQVVPIEIFDYIILNNGSYIYDVKNDKGKYLGVLSKDIVSEITEQVEEVCNQIDFISGTTYYTYKKKKNIKVDFIKNVESYNEIQESLSRMNIFLKDKSNVEKYCTILNDTYKDINCFIMQDSESEEQWLVINPNGINKKITLERLGKEKNIDMSEIIFFGDGLNDLEVIEAVGCGVAMGNALDEIKKKAKEITTSNNEDGIFEFLSKKYQKQLTNQ